MREEEDLQAAFGLFWADATLVHERSHAGRTLKVLQSASKADRPTSYVCFIADGDRPEGWLTLSPEGGSPRVSGPLITRDHESFNVRLDSFSGGPLELADLACRLLDYDYKFPPDIGVTANEFVWVKKPPPYRR